jgi:hypothetical protein
MSLGRWPWVVLALAVLAVGLAALREGRVDEPEVLTPEPRVSVVEAPPLDGPEEEVQAIEAWCLPLLELTADDPASVVASAFSSVAEVAPEQVSVDLVAAALVLESGGIAVTTSAPGVLGPQVQVGLVDAEGRVPEDDPVLRVADHIESLCRRTASNPGPAAVAPTVQVSDDDAG